jgi:hypothetical protein
MLKAVLTIKRSVEGSYYAPTVFVLEAVDHTTEERVAGHEVHLEIAGDGSLRGGPVTKSSDEVTNELGMFVVSWWEYPNYSPRRELECEVHVSSEDPNVLIRKTTFFMGG